MNTLSHSSSGHRTRASSPVILWRYIAFVITAASCVDHRLTPPVPGHSGIQEHVIEPALQVDVLFAVDDSKSMRPLVENMTRNFPAFMDELKRLPTGLPDLHVAVVSTDLGAARGTAGSGCTAEGRAGRFETQARPGPGQSTCPVPRGSFIRANAAGTANNFDGDISDVFACIANLTENGGRNGCGFEHQLESVRRALGGSPDSPTPAENAGFLRPGALLVVVWLTNEDDCSAPWGSDLFDATLSDSYGPTWSFRCNRFGHTCNGAQLDGKATGPLDCRDAAGDGWQKLFPVSDYVQFFSNLKPAGRFLPIVISAPATPYRVLVTTTANATPALPAGSAYVDVSCGTRVGPTEGDMVFGDPGVRMQALAKAFNAPAFPSICEPDYHRVMTEIGRRVSERLEVCAPENLLDQDAQKPGIQADCVVSDNARNAEGERVRVADLPPCDGAGQVPAGDEACWHLVDSPGCGPQRKFEIRRVPGTDGSRVAEITCAVCPPGAEMMGCP